MGYKIQTKILFVVSVIALLFIAIRIRHYFYQITFEGHDIYKIVPKDGKCPDMEMFGLKFSAILSICIFNLFLTIYLISIK
jgi:hypothetical protein